MVPHSTTRRGSREAEKPEGAPWRGRLHEVIFEADTRAGKLFDVVLLVLILTSVMAVCVESVASIRARHGAALRVAEWVCTVLFTVEYGLRLLAVRRPGMYARSFFGIVDLLAILPTYVSAFVPGAQALAVIRGLRLLRVFRVFKLVRFVGESRLLLAAVRGSIRKITIFLFAVLTIVLIAGASMYVIEGGAGEFSSIPRSIYWAIVTLTTVGYGDITPATMLGQFLASFLMILGYGIIAVPTGIVTVGLAQTMRESVNTAACPSCGLGAHADDALYCRRCGTKL